MSKFFDDVDTRRSIPVAVAHRAALYLSSKKGQVVLTESGDDSFFYRSLLIRLCGRKTNIEFLQASCRRNVIQTLNILQKIGKRESSFAIIDRDFNFDDRTECCDGHCFVLDVYSFENYFAYIDAMVDVGKAFFTLEVGSEELKAWVKACGNFLDSLPASLREEHVIAIWCIRKSKRCLLGDFKPKAHLCVDSFGNIVRKPSIYEDFLRETRVDSGVGSIDVPSNELAACGAEIDGMDWRRWFRGHYFWSLFVEFLNKFRLAVDVQREQAGIPRTRTRAQIDERHALEAGSSFAQTPNRLNEFLSRIATLGAEPAQASATESRRTSA